MDALQGKGHDPAELQGTTNHPWFAVAVYDTAREYGGPEEGGWYYTAGDLDFVLGFYATEDEAYDAAQGERELDPGADAYAKSVTVVAIPRRESVYADQLCHMDSDQDDGAYRVRTDVPVRFPESRPHYC